MNERQKQAVTQSLRAEKAVLTDIKANYRAAMGQIDAHIRQLSAGELTQSKAYQIGFQQSLRQQVGAILDMMDRSNFQTVADYLAACYEDGFIGTMFDLQGQGIPLVLPIDQAAVAKMVQTTGDGVRLSKKLYKNTGELKKAVRAEVARGLSTGMAYSDIARNVANAGEINYRKAVRIAATEGHRVTQSSTLDAQQAAKAAGADVVKQWDATLDSKTRPDHAALDGQLKEVDEAFSAGGGSAQHPGGFGIASEDINCRCVLLQRARWALGNNYTKMDGDTGKLVTLQETGFDDFKRAYKAQM